MHEIHAPPLRGSGGHRGGAPVQGDVLASTDTHAELQAVEPIEPAHALTIDHPPFAAQQDPDPQVPEARSRVRELANAQPQGGLIARATAAIPRRLTEVRESTGRAQLIRNVPWNHR